MRSLSHMDPELDTVATIVESEPLRGAVDKYYSWRITGRDKDDVQRKIDIIKRQHVGSAQFTNVAQVPSGPWQGWYFAMGITYDE